ncbi:MAG: L,D-transpeptidase family protein [Candidatus Omnitrophota bacterium]
MKKIIFWSIGIVCVLIIIILVAPFFKTTFCSKTGTIYRSAKAFEKAGKLDEAIKEYEELVAEHPQSKKAAQSYILLASLYERQGKLVEAREAYKKAIQEYPNLDIASTSKAKIEDLSIRILFSPAIDSMSKIYEVQQGDTLGKIAKVFGETVELLKVSNDLDGDLIRQGMHLKVVTAKFSVVVDKSQNVLFLKQDEEILKIYRVSTGENNSTPAGTFKIVNKLVNPVWYSAGAVVPPGSPENILGSRWLGISKPGYGIHGTTDPSSIGKQVTAGCVRMLNLDAEELYTILPEGTEVTIVD